MLEISDMADALGLSEKQVRRRVKALDPIIGKHKKRGENNKLIFDSGALEMVRRMEDLRKTDGKTIEESAEQIRTEIEGNGRQKAAEKQKESNEPNIIALKVENKQLKARVNDLKEQIEYLQEQNRRLLPAGNGSSENKGNNSWWKFWRL